MTAPRRARSSRAARRRHIGRVHGSHANSYTAGVICTKVARYAERDPSPRPAAASAESAPARRARASSSDLVGRRARPDRRKVCSPPSSAMGPRRSGHTTTPAPWASSCATASTACATPRSYSQMFQSICTTSAWTGFIAGTGKLAGPDPREMAKTDLVVIWGTNPVNTQVNVMTHAIRARKERGARIVAVDIYQQRHHGSGGSGPLPPPRHRRRARLCRDARALPRRLRQLALDGEIHRLPARAGSPSEDANAGMGQRHHRPHGR